MSVWKSGKIDLKRLSQGAALCGVPIGGVGGGSLDMLGVPALGEGLSLALALGAFVGVGAWMFRRWGKSPAVQAPTEPSPGVAVDPQREPELINA